jgi:hypothetical protein
MSDQAEACRRKAAECERAAALATDPGLKATYRDLARQWREMVEHSKDLERLHSSLKENRGHAFMAYEGPDRQLEGQPDEGEREIANLGGQPPTAPSSLRE